MKTIDGVPESITRDQYLALIAGAGFTTQRILRLEFRPDGIYAEMLALGERGQGLADRERGEPLIDKVYIPVRDADS